MSVARPETIDRRILGAIVFLDALGRRVRSPVAAAAAGATLWQKEPGVLIVAGAPGLSDHVAAFAGPPGVPVLGSVELAVDLVPADPALAPRRAIVPLPRDPDPANAAEPDSLFRPQEIVLWPSPRGVPSGLQEAERILKGVKGVSFNYFTSKDVVRHPLVARIIEAYEADEAHGA